MTLRNDDDEPFVDYEWIEGVEWLSHYRPGGYHPIYLGDQLHGRYRIIHKLGSGGYSTIWLARDEQQQHGLGAVKVGTSYSRSREVEILSILSQSLQLLSDGFGGQSPIRPLLDSFDVKGPNGIHPCYVTAPAMCSLSGAKSASYNSVFQLDVGRALAAQLVLAVASIHSQGVVHGGELPFQRMIERLPSASDMVDGRSSPR
jgi:serine/threonine protein kinase